MVDERLSRSPTPTSRLSCSTAFHERRRSGRTPWSKLCSAIASSTLAINLDVAVEVVTERMMARGREDDTPESIARRLELYEAETAPLLSWAEDRGILHVVDGLGTEEEVFARLQKVIETV